MKHRKPLRQYTLDEYRALPICKTCGERIFPDEPDEVHKCMPKILAETERAWAITQRTLGVLTGHNTPVEW
jgi:hypothetical protein